MRDAIPISNSIPGETNKFARKRKITVPEIMETNPQDSLRSQTISPSSFKLKKRSVGGKGLQDSLSFNDMKAIDDLVFGLID